MKKLPLKKLPPIILVIIALTALLAILLISPVIVGALNNRSQPPAQAKSISTTASTGKLGASGLLTSHNTPIFASSETYPASNAEDGDYNTTWRSNGTPAELAFDLSKVPTDKRSKVLVVWYNETSNYDHTIISTNAYNMPQNYTIDVNTAAGGSNPPKTGWVTLETVKDNHYHSRQHVITMTGYNWLRMHITAVDGSAENYDAAINMDIYDANEALNDDWIFFGDSITAGAMGHDTLNGTSAFAQLINAHAPNNYPVQESGGIGYLTSTDGAKYISTWLHLFPGRYVGLSYGTNDALGCVDPATFYKNYVTMVQDVLNAGKIPLVPYIPWGRLDSLQNCVPTLNAQITKLYSAFPNIIHGPDLWSFFKNHQDLIAGDNIHPTTDAGFGAYRQQWANTILTEVYHIHA